MTNEDYERLPFWSSVAEDIRAQVSLEDRPTKRTGWLTLAARIAVRSSGFRAVLNYRVAHALRPRFGPAGKQVSRACFWFGRHWYGCSIASTARLHGGLVLPHPQGIVIGECVIVGPGSWIFHNVTVGASSGKEGMPRIGAGARIYAGAVIVGPVVLGENVTVGANAVVARDFPAGSTVRAPRVQNDDR
jgi:serine O-acetyltransferase